MTTDWQPTDYDLNWQKGLLQQLTHMGVWGVPVSESIFQINKVMKTITLQAGDINNETNQRVIKCCAACGYTYTPDPNEN